MKLSEIAKEIGAEMIGGDVEITGVCGVTDASSGCLTWAENDKNLAKAIDGAASAVIVKGGTQISSGKKPFLFVDNPKLYFAKALSLFSAHPALSGIHETAIAHSSSKLSASCAVGAYAVIGENTAIGDNAKIYNGSHIGANCRIGNNVTVYPNVNIMDGITIGNNVIIHSGAVIGADGFGYVKQNDNTHFKIPQIGSVLIGDDVEIGANTCIDRATTGLTKIGRGTKIDNLIHIAHNVEVGEDCIIVACTGVAGSTKIGSRVILAAQVGVAQHVEIGDDCLVLGRAGVTKNIKPKSMVSGYPAKNHREELKIESYVVNLPKIVEELKKRIGDLESKVPGTA